MAKKSKVLLIGWDAADWKIIGPLLAKGEMPALQSIIDRGVYGNMATMNPPYSPMLWSSVATGKTPDKHGIHGFVEITPDHKGVRPITVTSRKSRAIWNILHNKGYKSNLVGWWPSFPAEPINGNVITDKFQKTDLDPRKIKPINEKAVHPKSLIEEVKDLRVYPFEITAAHILPFIPDALKIDQEKDTRLQSFAKMIAENASLHAASTYLMKNKEWDFMGVYYDLIDHFCHVFMRFYPPMLKGVSQDRYELYNQCVIGAYKFQDMMLSRTLELIDKDTTVIVMSDHGYESGHRRILKMPKVNAAPAMEHRQYGMFVAAGPNIKKNQGVYGLSLIDITPTVLHMFDLPVGKDMDGKVALDIFKTPKTPTYIDSWEDVAGDFGEHKQKEDNDILNNDEAMAQLIELGYIEGPGQKIEDGILKTKYDLKQNLARVYLGKKDFEKAKEILEELIKETSPLIDLVPYYIDLLSISIAQKSFKKAREYLNIIKKSEKKFGVKTYFYEGELLLQSGQVQKALKLFKTATEKDPNSETWYRLGKVYMRLYEFENAKQAFENALELEIDKAKIHLSLANTLIALEEYEAGAESAITAIELVRHFPEAHYALGKALEKLGDLENAKKAYETAKMLKPKTYARAEKAIENLDEKAEVLDTLEDKVVFKHRENQIVVVSGLPRSGTSLMMQMLDKGGVEILTDGNRKPDTSNPKGYYEYDPVMRLNQDNTWLEKGQNKAVKIVAPLLGFLDPQYRYKVIFMNRDINEIIKSQNKMAGRDENTLSLNLMNTFIKHLNKVNHWKDNEPSVELMYVNHQDILNNTDEVVKKVTQFIGLDMDTTKMASCVDMSLYRNRK